MSNAWTSNSFQDRDLTNVLDQVQGFLNSLPLAGTAILFSATDPGGGDDSRGIVFWASVADQEPIKSPKWQLNSYFTKHQYESDLYVPMLNFLNDATKISLQSQFFARLNFAKHHDGHASLTLFYPTS